MENNITRAVYQCSYDSNDCKVIPQFDNTNGMLQKEDWKTLCNNCERNFSLGEPYGKICMRNQK